MSESKKNDEDLERNFEVNLGDTPEEEMTLEKYKRLYLAEKGKNRARKVTAAIGLLIYKAILCVWMSCELSHWQDIYNGHDHHWGTVVWDSLVLIYSVVSAVFDIWFLIHELRKLREFCKDYHFYEHDLIFDAWNFKRKAHMPPALTAEERRKIDAERLMLARDLAIEEKASEDYRVKN